MSLKGKVPLNRKDGFMEENKKLNEEELEQPADITEEAQDDTLTDPEENKVEETQQTENTEKTEETDKAKEYLDRLQRLMAEFDNFRKRTDKEKQNLYDLGVSNTVSELLTVVDNFERAMSQECTDKTFGEGVTIIYKQLMSVLEKLHVTTISAAGEVFDPNLHNAVLHIEDESVGENIIVEELQKGYFYKEKVIRHSIVKVAN
jgi:molecular chaperone GrpE